GRLWIVIGNRSLPLAVCDCGVGRITQIHEECFVRLKRIVLGYRNKDKLRRSSGGERDCTREVGIINTWRGRTGFRRVLNSDRLFTRRAESDREICRRLRWESGSLRDRNVVD